MHAEVDFIFPSSAKITIKLNLVYLFNETQDPCPDGFNQSPRYVVIRGFSPVVLFLLNFQNVQPVLSFERYLQLNVSSFTCRLSRGDP